MDGMRLQVGDRIALLQAYLGLPARSQGAITHVYATEPDLYRVRFDNRAHDVPIFRHYLERLAGAPNARAPDRAR